jgi:hypothetical protein
LRAQSRKRPGYFSTTSTRTHETLSRGRTRRELDKALGARLHVALVANVVEHLVVGDDAAEPVGAEQEAVAGLQ